LIQKTTQDKPNQTKTPGKNRQKEATTEKLGAVRVGVGADYTKHWKNRSKTEHNSEQTGKESHVARKTDKT